MTKLKYTEIKTYRDSALEQQNYKCFLCNELIVDDAVLDHDHKTGLIRRVLHRGCNVLLGKIENNMARNRISLTRLEGIARNLITYVTTTHTDTIHPRHKIKTAKSVRKRKNAHT